MQPEPDEAFKKCAQEWESQWYDTHWVGKVPRHVKHEFLERRFMNWNDLLSKYWIELPLIEADLEREWDRWENFGAELHSGSYKHKHAESRLPYGGGKDYRRDRAMERQRSERRGHEFYGFLHLPPEVRLIIYEYLLVVGNVFVPNSTYDHSGIYSPSLDDPLVGYLRAPQLCKNLSEAYYRYRDYRHPTIFQGSYAWFTPSLIKGVCKTVQYEAERVIWSRNRFILPYGSFVVPKGFSFGGEIDSGDCMHLARDLSYTFDMREGTRSPGSDYSGPAIDPQMVRDLALVEIGNSPEKRVARLEKIHDEHAGSLQDCWYAMAEALKEKTKLKRLQLDFEECYCPLGCCRLVDYVCSLLQDDWAIAVPEVIEVLGWVDDEEKNSIHRDLCLKMITKDKIVFVSQDLTNEQPSEQPSEPHSPV